MKKLTLLFTGLLLGGAVTAQSISRCEYWFDRDYAARQDVFVTNNMLQWQAEASSLSAGLHWLNLHVQDATGLWSSPRSFAFMHIPTLQSASASYTYWFDQNRADSHSGTLANGTLPVNASSLSAGLHLFTLICQVGTNTRVEQHLFYKMPEATLTFHYRVDNGPYQTASANVEGAVVNLNLDMTALEEGHHTIEHFASNSNNNILSPVQIDTFERTSMPVHYTLTVLSADETMGAVDGGGSWVENTEVTITALPNDGYHFIRWNDGNAINPRVIVLTSDTAFTAFFEADPVGIGEHAMEQITAYGYNGNIIVSLDAPKPVWIYDLEGRQLAYRPVIGAGTYAIPVPDGVYIVKVGESFIRKVIVTK